MAVNLWILAGDRLNATIQCCMMKSKQPSNAEMMAVEEWMQNQNLHLHLTRA